MPSKPNSAKISLDLDPHLKHKLGVLKADLRLQGLPATETLIIELLLSEAKTSTIARLLRRHLDTQKP
jgi:hypothetical protein